MSSISSRQAAGTSVASSPRRALPGYYVSAYNGLHITHVVMDATWTSASTLVTGHTIASDCTDLRVVLPFGWRVSSAGSTAGEVVAPNGTATKVALVVGGVVLPVTFNGLRNVTCDPWGRLISDPIAGVWTKGTQLQVRVLNGNISGASYPNGLPGVGPGATATGNGFTKNSDIVDATTAAGSGNSSDNLWNPLLIGAPTATKPFVLGALSDSIGFGTGETSTLVGYSWVTRASNATVPLFRNSIGGQTAQGLAALSRYSMQFFSGCTHVLVQLGTNDLGTRTYAQIIADLSTLYAAIAAQGCKVIGCTIIPKTASTDNWSTVAGQTVTATGYTGGAASIRSQVNAWIRAGGGGLLASYVELADAVETSRDSGIFQAFGGRVVTDAAITTGTAVLTSATAAFTSVDVGRTVVVLGAGAAGAALTARISTYTNATTVSLSSNAGTTVSAATANITGPSTDGTHPSSLGHAAMAAAVNLTTLAAL